MSLPNRSFYLYDAALGALVIQPRLAGIREAARVCIYSRIADRYTTIETIPSDGKLEIPVQNLTPSNDKLIKLQLRSKGAGTRAWRDYVRLSEIEELRHLAWVRIRPSDWGVTEDCTAILEDTIKRAVLVREVVKSGHHIERLCDIPPFVQRLRLSFYPLSDGSEQAPLIRPVRYCPPQLVGPFPEKIHQVDQNLEFTVRENVVISPIETIRSRPWYKYEGIFTATARGRAVVEAMEFALGRQSYLFAPADDFVDRSESVVYLGPLHPSYGHFLTQSLSRAWYAARNPDQAVVWQPVEATPTPGDTLRPYQREILDFLGINNPMIMLDEPTRFDEVVFPFPLVSIGDYLLPEFASFIGCVPCANAAPGKKLFLSRSKLDLGRGSVVGGDHLLDDVMEKHGFIVFHPQDHSLTQQLHEISSAEVVVGIEGSALHSVLLLQDPVKTRFFAIARHHAGAGVFDHIRAAKPGLRYETLSFSSRRPNSARQPLELDLLQLDRVLQETEGLMTRHDALTNFVQKPVSRQTSYRAHIANCKGDLTPFEADMVTAFLATKRGDRRAAELAIGNWL